MAELTETLVLLEQKVLLLTEQERLRLEQERDFLKAVRKKSLGGATAKEDSAKETDVLLDVQTLLGLD